MNIQHALLYDPQGHLGTLLARGPWGDVGLTPTDLKAKEIPFLQEAAQPQMFHYDGAK